MTRDEPALGPRHHEVKRLRALLRDRGARRTEEAFVLEGPRLVADALRRGAPIETLYLGPGAKTAFAAPVADARAAGIRVCELKEGVLEKVGTTRTPQPVLAVSPIPRRVTDLRTGGVVMVLVGVADPGNLGTLLRSAEAAAVGLVLCCGETVDAFNPKTVRSSAGAIFGVPVVEDADPVHALGMLGAAGYRRIGTVATGGRRYTDADLGGAIAIVLGSEAHGLPEGVADRLDERVTIPMAGALESLNLAVAGSVLCFEAARQRAATR
ncbi:MAG: RNA methyltransferase [Actinobacteria bacterium]|nr:RNA methyltransferase [Actinomycetota bacterium]